MSSGFGFKKFFRGGLKVVTPVQVFVGWLIQVSGNTSSVVKDKLITGSGKKS
jgi:hypothetical protein